MDAPRLALIDILDRDGQVRHSHAVHAWPLRIGRALDNDIVLSDPHVAAEHLHIDLNADGLAATVGPTRNGARIAGRRLQADQTLALDGFASPLPIDLGRTHLRLRLPGEVLPAELPMAADTAAPRGMTTLIGALALLAAMLFNTWLENDPDGLTRAIGGLLTTSLAAAGVWCGAWALLSKTFTRQSHFPWHVRVFVFAALAWLAVGVVPAALAFAFSWSWITDFSFIATFAVAGATLYFHLLAVEPARPRLMRAVGVAGALIGIALTLWFNNQRSERFGDELYMSHLFPPALRVAKPVPVDSFVKGLAPLRERLDKQAKQPPNGDAADDAPGDDEE